MIFWAIKLILIAVACLWITGAGWSILDAEAAYGHADQTRRWKLGIFRLRGADVELVPRFFLLVLATFLIGTCYGHFWDN